MTQDTTNASDERTDVETSEEEDASQDEQSLTDRVRERLPGGGDSDEDDEGGEDDQELTKKLRLVIKLAQDVAVPRSVAYNQWTQLEDFPQFMKGVQAVDLDDDVDPGNITNSNWTVKIGITRRQFSAEVTEAVPDERIAWKATGGCEHKGVVSFATLDDNDALTRVQVEMEYIPGDFIEKIGNIFLAARRKARKDLRLFKHYMELQAEETGAWREEITRDGEDEEPEEEEDVDDEEEAAASSA
jgi:uncharacterized membrane protein